MEKLKFFKEVVLPQTPVPHAVYLVKAPGASFAEMYITDAAGNYINTGNTNAITEVVNQVMGSLNSIIKVANIAARNANAANQETNAIYLVIDASADPTVNTGGATYFYDDTAETFEKISEFEGLDAITNWEDIVNKPTSSANAIDNAVANSHTHTNKAVIDKFGQDADGDPTYDGEPIVHLKTSNW